MSTYVRLMFTTNSTLSFLSFRFVCYIFWNYIFAISRISDLNDFGNTLSDCAFFSNSVDEVLSKKSYLVCNLERHRKTRAVSEIIFLSFESLFKVEKLFLPGIWAFVSID